MTSFRSSFILCMYSFHATSDTGVISWSLFFTEKMGHDGELVLIFRRVLPDPVRLVGEDAEMVASAQNCGLYEGHFPGAWGPR